MDEWEYGQCSSGISTRPRRYGRIDTCVKTDILVEPEVKGSEQLYKEIYILIHTAYIVYTMQLKCCCFYTRSSKHVKRSPPDVAMSDQVLTVR